MESDELKVNDKNRDGTIKDAAQLFAEKTIFNEAKFYASSNDRQKAENKKRTESRERIAKVGLRTDAVTLGIKLVKNMSPKDRKIFLEDLTITLEVVGNVQADLFPEDVAKQKKKEAREEAAAAEAARVAKENAATDPDKKHKSDPKRGGAGGVNGRAKAKDKDAAAAGGVAPPTAPEVPGDEGKAPDGTGENDGPREGESEDAFIKRQAQERNSAVEQRDGAKVLEGHFPKSGSPRKSQSAQAAEILEKNGLNKPLH